MSYRASGSTLPVVVVTDGKTIVPPGMEVFRVPNDPEFCRTSFHKAGWLRACAARALAPCVLIDTDAFVLRNIDGLKEWKCGLAIGADPQTRHHEGWPEASPEMNRGVLVVNDPNAGEFYVRIFRERREEFRRVTILDQLVWTAVWREMGGEVLPREYNWSHWWKERDKAIVFHEHGKKKFADRSVTPEARK